MTNRTHQSHRTAIIFTLGLAIAIWVHLKRRRSLPSLHDSRPVPQPEIHSKRRQNPSLRGILTGAVIAVVAGIIGAWVQGYSWYYYEGKRATAQRRADVIQKALEWAGSGRRQTFRGVDLQAADLTGANLGASPEVESSYADLSHSNLSHADFTRATLTRADLTNADVSGADFLGADLSQATLYGLTTTRARFIDCDFRNARISSHFQNIDFAMSRFQNADLTWSDFIECNLTVCDFRGADLSGVNFTSSRMDLSDLRNTNLSHSVLVGVDLSSSDLEGAILTNSDLRGATLHDVNLSQIVYNSQTHWPEGFQVPSDTVKLEPATWGTITYTVEGTERSWYVKPVTQSVADDIMTPEERLEIIDRSLQDDVLSKLPGYNEKVEGIRKGILEELRTR